jgi:hypothetical protein
MTPTASVFLQGRSNGQPPTENRGARDLWGGLGPMATDRAYAARG